MSLWQVIVCVLALCLAGVLVLSQAMDRHCDQLVARGEPGPMRRAVLRLVGVALILLALWLCAGLWGAAVGSIFWLGGLSVAALALTWMFAYWPGPGAVLVAMGGLAALAGTLMAAFRE
ncbi:DUF3325 domain-containing protein [uncultured Comamonas sp.]|uniref:DUF3325 domain-containing protein n=1 Tax=uncultured Comamonas sp. TaxID=114710 RepID=UPI0025E946C9|nr:DUF3325 domain-containing protein [uncultured Comamonas sp.]